MRTRLLAVALILLACSFAYAGSVSCSTATVMVPDGRILDFDNVPISTTTWYQFTATANRSYSLEVRDDLEADPGSDLTIKVYTPTSTCASLTAATNTTDTHASEPVTPTTSGKRWSIVTTSSGATGGGVYLISVQNTSATLSHYVSLMVSETTLYATAYTTTSANTYFYITNTTSAAVSYTYLFTSTGGTTATYATSVTANGVNAQNTSSSSMNVPATSQIGYVTITHNGPPGALQCMAETNNAITTPPAGVIACGPIREHR